MRIKKNCELTTRDMNINVSPNTCGNMLGELLNRMGWDVKNCEPEQLNHMNARIYGGRTLESYATPVAYYDGVNVIELGCYSRTTSKQVTTWAEMHGADVIRLTDLYKYTKDNGADIFGLDDNGYYVLCRI